MLKLTKVLTGITMAVLVFLLIALYGAVLQVRLVSFEAVSAAETPERFNQLYAAARRDDMGSDLYKRPASEDAADYNLITITLQVKNAGVLPAEWLSFQLSPLPGDVALFAGEATDIGPFGTQTITITLLSEVEAETDRREVWAEYYVFGRKMNVAAR